MPMIESLANLEAHTEKRFSEEQRRALEERSFVVFDVGGKTLESLKHSGVYFWSEWHKGDILERLTTGASEVAVNTSTPFLRGSEGKTVTEQSIIASKYSDEISKGIPGVRAVIGSAVDYMAIEAKFKGLTGRSVFRTGSSNNYATTVNSFNGHQLFAGEFYDGSSVVSYRFGETYSDIKVMPLVVPN